MKGYLIAAMLILTFSVLTFAADDTLPFKITTKRTDDRVRVKSQNNKVVFNIRNPTGISNATAERTRAVAGKGYGTTAIEGWLL